MKKIILLLLLWSALPVLAYNHTKSPEPVAQATVVYAEVNSDSLLDVVNRVRAANGCNEPLIVNDSLQTAAQERAEYVADGHWYHDGYIETVKKYYRYSKLGENLARDFSTDEAIVTAWLNSPKHKENLINCRYKEIGIGRSGTVVTNEYGVK